MANRHVLLSQVLKNGQRMSSSPFERRRVVRQKQPRYPVLRSLIETVWGVFRCRRTPDKAYSGRHRSRIGIPWAIFFVASCLRDLRSASLVDCHFSSVVVRCDLISAAILLRGR